ncbi:hypothetical protein F4803DRAFT_553502 [Xylaria telfairii]|nr:hypothetical protein F4803DRAFT_553502 [Xylaria telfairii]
MADQAKNNQVKGESASKKEDQVKDELTANNKGQVKEDGLVKKGNQVKKNGEDEKGATHFPKFLLLPAELRLIIWEYALPEGRVLRIVPNEETDDEDDDEGNDEDDYDYNDYKKYNKKGIDQWGFPTCCYAPEILNAGKFVDFPLAQVCQESREFIIDFGYELLYKNLMTVNGDLCWGPWFCDERDSIEEFTDDLIIGLSRGHSRGDWIYE